MHLRNDKLPNPLVVNKPGVLSLVFGTLYLQLGFNMRAFAGDERTYLERERRDRKPHEAQMSKGRVRLTPPRGRLTWRKKRNRASRCELCE
jgi:hypothetical protein